MAIAAWVMMGLAIWHFMVWIPDRVIGGIAGSFVIAAAGAVVGGLVLNGFDVPGRDELGTIVPLQGIPGTIIALAIGYAIGAAREQKTA